MKILRNIFIFSLIGIFFWGNFVFADANQEKIEQLRQQIEELERQAQLYRGNIAVTQAQANTLKNQIQNLKNQISALEANIKLTGKKIDKTEVEIVGVEDHIQTTQEKIDYQRSTIRQLLQYLAKRDNETLVGVLMKNASLSEYFNQEQYALTVNSSLLDAVNDLKATEEDLSNQKEDLEGRKKELETLRQQAAAEKASLSNVTADKNKVLKDTKGQEAQYQKMLADVEERERQANLEVFKLEEELRRSLDPNSLPSARHGVLSLPVNGRISQAYGCIHTSWARKSYPLCDDKKGGFHNGLDIAAALGTPLRAAEGGKVVAEGNAPYAYGIWTAIEHPNGLVTAYTHMSTRAVEVGQTVARGDIVGYMGSTGYSTGSHLHFMVYAPRSFSVKKSAISGLLPIGATLSPKDYLD